MTACDGVAEGVVEPMEFHGPGWTARFGAVEFWVWGPNDRREGWRACWQTINQEAGDFRTASTWEEALTIFGARARDARARDAFRAAIVAQSEGMG